MKKQTLHWLQNAFSFYPSSSSRSPSDDNLMGGRRSSKSSFALRNRKGSNRQLTRARKLRHLGDKDVQLQRSPSSRDISSVRSSSVSVGALAPPSPVPLPMPELQLLLRQDSKLTSQSSAPCNAPLPSPIEAHHISRLSVGDEKEREGGEASNAVANNNGIALRRLRFEDTTRKAEHPGTRSSRRSPSKRLCGTERISDNNGMNFPCSAPCSPYLGPGFSPPRSTGDATTSLYISPPTICQVWSAPELPSSDRVLCTGTPFRTSCEMAAHSFDHSSFTSPRLSPLQTFRSSNGPPSPSKLQIEIPVARRDSNAQATNVHPLPLPPGAAMPSPHTPVPQPTPKSDLVPVKDQWQKGKLIGRGTFGSVYVASNKETGALCAMKEVEILHDDPKSAESIKQLQQEIKVLSHLKHPNIVQYYGSEIVDDHFYIYLEYVHPGSINKFIRDHCGAITESVVRNFTRHILCGLAYLHSKKTIHRDIKGANLLVDAYGVVKLADFGMAKHLSGQVDQLSLKGSPYWLAPELLQSVMQTDASTDLAFAIDIWSLGCTIIEMMNGKPPWSEYEGPAAMFKVLKESPSIPENLSAEGKDFLHLCFRRNPAERPSASMLLEHHFVRSPHPPDVLSQSLGGMKLTNENDNTQQERSSYKLDQVPTSLGIHPLKMGLLDKSVCENFTPVRLFGDVSMRL